MEPSVHIYDTTLRDGTQGEGFELTVDEKIQVAEMLCAIGVSYIEGGWPGSNPRDVAFFERIRGRNLGNTRVAAFGSTRRRGIPCEADPSIQALLAAECSVVTIFGKAWKFHATGVLGISAEENLHLVHDTVRYLATRVDEVIFDAEHFFDGAADDDDYAFQVLEAAADAGARFLTLCDTNGGTMPYQVEGFVARAKSRFNVPIGIHTHNDCELAVANSIVAVRYGATMVQGTLNGYGERCGNANLCSVIPSLELKMNRRCVKPGSLSQLTRISRTIDAITNNEPIGRAAYVGRSAFAHKGGVHVNAVMKHASTYEHVEPETVGNQRRVLVSDLSGRSNVRYKAAELGVEAGGEGWARDVLQRVKSMESRGWQFEGAEASLMLLMREASGQRPRFFEVQEATVSTKIHVDGGEDKASAWVRVKMGQREVQYGAVGNGPVDALAAALMEILEGPYPVLRNVRLTDYKVRILDSGSGCAATVRVLIRATDGVNTWGTVGVSTNVVEASWHALVDAFDHKLIEAGVRDLDSVAA